MEATQHAIDHPATLLVAVAVGKFNRLVEGHWGWCPQAFQVNHSQPKDVAIDPRKSRQSPTLHHLIQACIDALPLAEHLLNPLHGATANLLLVPEQQQPRQLKAGGQPIQHLFGGTQGRTQVGTNGVMGSGFPLLQFAVQQRLLGLIELSSTGIKGFTPVLGEGVESLVQNLIKGQISHGG